jgi:hypothetical protein
MSAPAPTAPAAETLTSKDYYFDSYAHFGKFLLYNAEKKVALLLDLTYKTLFCI